MSRRSKASGFTRIRVRSMLLLFGLDGAWGSAEAAGSAGCAPMFSAAEAAGSAGCAPMPLGALARRAGGPLSLGARLLARRGDLVALARNRGRARRPRLPARRRPRGRRGASGARPPRLGRSLAHLGLAVGADLPARVERLAADAARLLQAAQAARAAQERLLHVEAAVRALELVAGSPGAPRRPPSRARARARRRGTRAAGRSGRRSSR